MLLHSRQVSFIIFSCSIRGGREQAIMRGYIHFGFVSDVQLKVLPDSPTCKIQSPESLFKLSYE